MNKNEEMGFAEMFAESTANLLVKTHTIIDATVLFVDRHYVTVDAGLPIEAIIPTKEFLATPEVGDTIKVIVFALDNGRGQVAISHHFAIEKENKELIEKAIGEKSIITAKVAEVQRAGLKVYIGVVEGFLPNSLIDTIRIEGRTLLGKEISVVPLSIDDKKRNVVVSRKQALIIERGGALEPMEGILALGDVREGIIKNIVKFGAFVDLGGRDVLAHISDMKWDVSSIDPFKEFEIGQRIKGLINKSDDNGRFCISLRHSDMAPWEAAKENLKIGDSVKCKVHKITEDRSLIVVVNGVAGTVPSDEISWTHKKGRELFQTYSPGTEVEAMVTGFVDTFGEECVQLSIKKNQENPWIKAKETIKEGNIISVSVSEVSEHNVTVAITPEISAVVPFKELSWGESASVINDIHAGDEVKVKIITVNPNTSRVIASIREAKENPFTSLHKGSRVNCSVIGFNHNGDGLFVEIHTETTSTRGIVSPKNALPELAAGQKVTEFYAIGDKVKGVVVGIDGQNIHVSLANKKKSIDKKSIDKKSPPVTHIHKSEPNTAMFDAMNNAKRA